MIDFVALANLLEEREVGKTCKDIFIDTLPDEAPKGIVLRSSIAGDEIDYYLPGLMKATFRLIVRASFHSDGLEMIQKAIQALTVWQPTKIGNMRVRSCRPITTPMVYPLSNGNLREFSVNMKIIYDELTEEEPEVEQTPENGEQEQENPTP